MNLVLVLFTLTRWTCNCLGGWLKFVQKLRTEYQKTDATSWRLATSQDLTRTTHVITLPNLDDLTIFIVLAPRQAFSRTAIYTYHSIDGNTQIDSPALLLVLTMIHILDHWG